MLRLQPVSRQVLIIHYLAISLSSPVCYAYVYVCFIQKLNCHLPIIGVNDFKREKTYTEESDR